MNNNEPFTVGQVIDMLQHLPEDAILFIEVEGTIVPVRDIQVEENDDFVEPTLIG